VVVVVVVGRAVGSLKGSPGEKKKERRLSSIVAGENKEIIAFLKFKAGNGATRSSLSLSKS
jgi:hypothetical protein